MRFAQAEFLWGSAFAFVLAAILILQGILLSRARHRFGSDQQVGALLSARSGIRRGVSGVLVCLAVALSFVAAAQPQYGKGTRVLPATNLDVVLVLDFSKSMYARDVTPSRIERAKVEVVNLVRELAGARFGAVAFAGESISFPLTSDGGAIAQFFRGLSPNDMAVGGTAIARALASAQSLLERDPLSKNHERVLVLITDGEDLEGDPVQVAREAAASGIRVEVVQIGGQTPEPIPDIDESGKMVGLRRERQGQIMTTQLSAEGEVQLQKIASEGQGQLVRASAGQTGIEDMTARLRRLMTEELSERVETVYADVFQYPLALAVLLLMLEVWIGTAPRARIVSDPPRGNRTRGKKGRGLSPRSQVVSSLLLLSLCFGCERVHPLVDDQFLRESPEVNRAIAALEEKDPERAQKILVEYLETGPCEEGVLGVGERAREHESASFDLALALGQIAEQSAKKSVQAGGTTAPGPASPGAAPSPPSGLPGVPGTPGGPHDPTMQGPDEELLSKIGCALRLLAPISLKSDLPAELRARSYYLSGNLELLRTDFESAIESYDEALLLTPGVPEGQGDTLGASIAYNRALALRLLQEEKEREEQEKQENQDENQGEEGEDGDQQQDGEDESPEDQEQESEDEQEDEQNDKDEQDGEDEQEDGENEQDQGKGPDEQPPEEQDSEQSGSGEQEQDEPQQQGQEPPPAPAQAPKNSAARDERMLDLLEQAPTLQQHDAQRRKAIGAGRPTMEDK